jgi:hypothetical protein
MQFLRQSTAATVIIGAFVSDTDFKSAASLLTITQSDVQLMKNGSAANQKNTSGTATHRANGDYAISLDTTDTNTTGHLRVSISKTGALIAWADFTIVTAAVYDLLFGSSADLHKAKMDQMTFDTANRLSVNQTHVLGHLVKGTGQTNDPWGPS